MKSILETCVPRDDIVKGTFNPEIFTASLSQVLGHYRGREGLAENLYTDTDVFFAEATYPTEGMRMVVADVFARIDGDNTAPAIQRLQTAFGGGKTHTLIALTHLAFRGHEIASAVEPLFGSLPLRPPGEVAVAGIAGDELPVHESKARDLAPFTLWGEIAVQIGGEGLYREVEADATSHAAPGRTFLEAVFAGRKALVMLDELAQYATRLDAARADGAEQLAAFVMALHGYARTRPGLSIVLTLASQADAFARQSKRLAELVSGATGREVDEGQAIAIAGRAEKGVRSVIARDATTIVPVQAAEISRVLAKRLFETTDRDAAEETAEAYAKMYARTAAALPEEATRSDYRKRMVELYPFHPSFIAFLNQKLASVETFQGTRGVLRVLALAVRTLWRKRGAVPMIQACHLDLRDSRTVNEIIGRTGAGELLQVLNTDVGGPDTEGLAGSRSRAELADLKNPHPAGYPLHEYTWKTVFLHSLAGRSEGLGSNLFGITWADSLLAVSFPGMTPPQVEAALEEIERSAYYLRRNEGRFHASLDPSINRALASIREGIKGGQVADTLAAAARKVVSAASQTFEVVHDVSEPDHVPDNRNTPLLGIVTLDAGSIDAEAFVTTVGPNRPRTQQNTVFLLVPETVRVAGETWNEDRVIRARGLQNRAQDLARTVLSMRRLKDRPHDYGITPAQLTADDFEPRLKERDLAFLTTVTQLYTAIWFASASGQVIAKPIKTAGGEGGTPVIHEIREALRRDGELVTAEAAGTHEAVLALSRLFFELGQTPSLAEIRKAFAERRRWPVLDDMALLDQVVRAGVKRGAWCLFSMGGEDRVSPEELYGRDTQELPFGLDLSRPDWCLVALEGARQRGWGAKAEVDQANVERWVAAGLAEKRAAHVADIVEKVKHDHGEVPDEAVLKAIDKLVQGDKAMTYSGDPGRHDKPEALVHGPGAILHAVKPGDTVLAPAEAARRGWVAREDVGIRLHGMDAAAKIVPLLGRLGGLYGRGAKSRIDVLDISDLEVDGGGLLRLQLTEMTPEGMKRLAELFETIAIVARPGPRTETELEISTPEDGCALIEALQEKK